MTPDGASPRMIGRRLGEARQLRGIAQEVAADHLGLSLPTLIAMEEGYCATSPAEIIKLAALYGRPVHWFARESSPVANFQGNFRTAVGQVGLADAEQVRESIADRPKSNCPERYRLLAVQAFKRGELTEKELANSLRCDVWEVRQIVKELL